MNYHTTMTADPIKIVRLDAALASFTPNFPFPHTYSEYLLTPAEEVRSRIADADIIITVRVPVTAEDAEFWNERNPGRKMIAVFAIGTDMYVFCIFCSVFACLSSYAVYMLSLAYLYCCFVQVHVREGIRSLKSRVFILQCHDRHLIPPHSSP